MIKIEINAFNTLNFQPHKINSINNKDRYFEVYIKSLKSDNDLIATVKINLKDREKSNIELKQKGSVVNPEILLTMNNFMLNYKDE